MELLIQLLGILSSFSPIAVIALLGVVILLLVKNSNKVDVIKGNDLWHLEDHLQKISEVLQRIEVTLSRVETRIEDKDRRD